MKWLILNMLLLIASPLVMMFYGLYIYYRLRKSEKLIDKRYQEIPGEKRESSLY